MAGARYVLVTACRNEESFIDGLIDSVAEQRVRPTRWVIVDDGSTDRTYERAVTRAASLPFVRPVRMPGGRPRTFGSKVFALKQAYEELRGCEFDFVGNLDADIRVEPCYYERLLSLMEADSRLGLGGGTVVERAKGGWENTRRGSEDFHVPGGVHFFRRECFEQVGGYVPIDAGGEDTIAEVTAMMHGWKVRAFCELNALHLRPEGVGAKNVLERGMRWGRRFYLLGYHPLFYFCHCLRRLGWQPLVLDSGCRLLGFVVASAKAEARPVSPEFVCFHRQMQLRRLRNALRKTLRLEKPAMAAPRQVKPSCRR